MGVVLEEGPFATTLIQSVLQVRACEILERAVRPEVPRVDVVAAEKRLGGLFRAQGSPQTQEMVILRDS